MKSQLFLLITSLFQFSTSTRPLSIKMTSQEPTHELTQPFSNSDHNNIYSIQLDSLDMLKHDKLFLIVECEDPSVILSILSPSSDVGKKSKSIIDLVGNSGNLMFVLD